MVARGHRQIHCCGCERVVMAVLTDGATIYPHRQNLHKLPFWRCPHCSNYVGCHHKTRHRTKPLGVIPTGQMRSIRSEIHAALDPIWEAKRMTRREVYAWMAQELQVREFHTAELRTVDDCFRAWRAAQRLAKLTARPGDDPGHPFTKLDP